MWRPESSGTCDLDGKGVEGGARVSLPTAGKQVLSLTGSVDHWQGQESREVVMSLYMNSIT